MVTTPHLDRAPRRWRSKARSSAVDAGACASAENAILHVDLAGGDALTL